jgi:hypothetical protein
MKGRPMATERTWILNGEPVTLAEYKAQIADAKRVARERFAREWRGLSPADAARVAVANAHLFKPANR